MLEIAEELFKKGSSQVQAYGYTSRKIIHDNYIADPVGDTRLVFHNPLSFIENRGEVSIPTIP